MTSGADVVGYHMADARAYLGTGMVDISIGIGILAVAYGVLVIVTAWGPRLKPDAIGYAIVATPIAKLWYGLAFIVPIAVTWSAAFLFNPRSLADSPYWDLVYWSGPASLAACILLARVSSVRPLKRAILAGRAARYLMSPDDRWWWDDSAWVAVATAAPEAAVRSPDDNYWWTGRSWVALPPRRRHA
jgi:hypothetical protein